MIQFFFTSGTVQVFNIRSKYFTDFFFKAAINSLSAMIIIWTTLARVKVMSPVINRLLFCLLKISVDSAQVWKLEFTSIHIVQYDRKKFFVAFWIEFKHYKVFVRFLFKSEMSDAFP